MARFHFNDYDGGYQPDKAGMELSDIEEARREAIRSAAAIIED